MNTVANIRAESDPPAIYVVAPSCSADDATIAAALAILERRVIGRPMESTGDVKSFLRLKLARLEHEEFCVLFLDTQNRVIALESMFRGTLTQTSVYPREVVKRTLALNAAAVVLAHNHPSGVAEPSRADELLTQDLKGALRLVDVRVLDHIVVSSSGCVSFAERGLL